MRIKENIVTVIYGSSNPKGNTFAISQAIAQKLGTEIYNLSDYKISYYDYSQNNRNDDFLPLIKQLIKSYDTYIFVSTVYLYSTSANLKTFLDRITDLLTIEKEFGRKLRGKYIIFVTSSEGNNLGDDFWIPIKATFEYLRMHFVLGMHCFQDSISKEQLKGITQSIKKK